MVQQPFGEVHGGHIQFTRLSLQGNNELMAGPPGGVGGIDRNSTRLNSSHLVISYAVFCLKTKKLSCILRSAGESGLMHYLHRGSAVLEATHSLEQHGTFSSTTLTSSQTRVGFTTTRCTLRP